MDAGRGELLPGCSGCFFNSLYIPFSRQSLARLSDTNLKPHFHVLATRTTRSEVEGGGSARDTACVTSRRVWKAARDNSGTGGVLPRSN